MKPETIAPSVMINGRSYTPPGWMWIVAFAIGGAEWALKQVDTQEFHETVQTWIAEHKCQNLEKQIADCEQHLAKLRQDLHIEHQR